MIAICNLVLYSTGLGVRPPRQISCYCTALWVAPVRNPKGRSADTASLILLSTFTYEPLAEQDGLTSRHMMRHFLVWSPDAMDWGTRLCATQKGLTVRRTVLSALVSINGIWRPRGNSKSSRWVNRAREPAGHSSHSRHRVLMTEVNSAICKLCICILNAAEVACKSRHPTAIVEKWTVGLRGESLTPIPVHPS